MKTQKQYLSLFAAVALLVGIALQVLPMRQASAAQITNRSLTLQAGATDGGSKPGGSVNHLFTFTVPDTTDPVGSIKFQYCTTAADVGAATCVTPTGLHTTSVTMGTQTGVSGFTINNATDGSPYITRVAAPIAAPGNVTIQLLGVVNPTTANQTFFARISTYSSSDTTGTPLDNGTVAASTTNQIVLTGTMPESLVFCTGQTVGTTAGVPDCTLATAGAVAFNQLFSPTDTAVAESQMAASTNAGSGYAITVNGPTLTSGTNTITALSSPTASLKGVSQFGMNLRANTSASATSFPGTVAPYISQDITAISNGTNYRAEPQTGYEQPDTFTFNNNAVVADSGYTAGGPGAPVASDAQIYTASYIVNVPGSQAAGTYTTTLTYICTPTF